MGSDKLTTAEADRIIKMLKCSLVDAINFPNKGKEQEFDVTGESDKDIFSINIYRAKIQPFKYNYGARIKKNGIVLLQLHINPTSVHYNPDGKKISGSHWHIYTEGFDRKYAFPAEDIGSDEFVENTIKFFKKFNIIDQPEIQYQLELI